MKYVYLVYEDCHGLIGAYGSSAKATECVERNILDIDPELLNVQPEFDSETAYGWEGACYWEREEIKY